jgi:hypothetical protein
VLATSVLVFEAIVVGLAIAVATRLGPAAGNRATVWLGLALVVLTLLAAGLLRHPVGPALGWVVQALVIATGLVVPVMLVLGALFAALWFAALHFGRKADAIAQARANPIAPDA